MSEIAIKLENISKQYRLGIVSTGTLSHDLNRWWANIRGKEDPNLKIGDSNKLAKSGGDYVWALKDINLEIKKGEILGIIGKNGAGKSTLLKLLSQVTGPTTGQIKVNGRIASLLEVGTGFHPELTGRENIFLNGAILGMRKWEIKNKLDEIVDFAGVAKYLDTPVKRYSSGMYVRLAFSVAAHLEPDILVVDEVLAVGDADFQKKAIGKMQDVSKGGGRTVLFVSHNMNSINTLCTSAVMMKNGQIIKKGLTQEIVNHYLFNENSVKTSVKWNNENAPGNEFSKLLSAKLVDSNNSSIDFIDIDTEVGIEFEYEIFSNKYQFVPNIHIFTNKNECVFVSASSSSTSEVGIHKATMWIPKKILNVGTYVFGIALSSFNPTVVHFYKESALLVEAVENINNRQSSYVGNLPGIVRPEINWTINKL